MSSEPLLPRSNSASSQKCIKILFTNETIPPMLLNISSIPQDTLTLKYLRQTIRNLKESETKGHTLRFLRAGSIVTSLVFQNQVSSYLNSENAEPFFLHCLIGVDTITDSAQILEQETSDDEGSGRQGNSASASSQGMGAIGFDRLRSVGFSDDEVELLRAQFRATYGDLESRGAQAASTGEAGSGENGAATAGPDIRELEEQWMENGVGDNDDRFNAVPNANFKHNKDLLIGISVGFLFGVFSLILLKLDGLFNERQRMSMIAGMIANFVLFLLWSS